MKNRELVVDDESIEKRATGLVIPRPDFPISDFNNLQESASTGSGKNGSPAPRGDC